MAAAKLALIVTVSLAVFLSPVNGWCQDSSVDPFTQARQLLHVKGETLSAADVGRLAARLLARVGCQPSPKGITCTNVSLTFSAGKRLFATNYPLLGHFVHDLEGI